jgi:hypothetical protein
VSLAEPHTLTPDNQQEPAWTAGTARTATSLIPSCVPGASSTTARPRRRSERAAPGAVTIVESPQRREVEVVAMRVQDQHGVERAGVGRVRRAPPQMDDARAQHGIREQPGFRGSRNPVSWPSQVSRSVAIPAGRSGVTPTSATSG